MFTEDTDWGTGNESPSTSSLHAALFEEGALKKKKRKYQSEASNLLHGRSSSSASASEGQGRVTKKLKAKKVSSTPILKKSVSSETPNPMAKSIFQTKLEKKMMGARFRWINEQLYTTTGEEAKKMFRKDPKLFEVYHHGFSAQVSKWPVNPLERILAFFQDLSVDKVVADFGCGEGKLAQSIPQKVFSFDLVACNTHIIACDMANVPLEAASVDVCVFCLSLMGTNVSDFIKEGRRVLINNGTLKICEIVSRMTSLVDFIESVESHGFKLLKQEVFSTMFVDLEFSAISRKATKKREIILKPCSYKRR